MVVLATFVVLLGTFIVNFPIAIIWSLFIEGMRLFVGGGIGYVRILLFILKSA